jgi:lysozyme
MNWTPGIDISHWQDKNETAQRPDFRKACAAGARFSFIKATQGNFADDDFVINWQNAKAAGLLRGAYHFYDWRWSAREQAEYFWSKLEPDPGELPPVLDFESRVGVPAKDKASQAAKDFMLILEQIAERKPMLYSSPGYWKEFGSTDPFWKGYPLWVAHYTSNPFPIVPLPWEKWDFWQHSSHGDGPAYGMESANVDLNWFNGSEKELMQFAGLLPAEDAALVARVSALERRLNELVKSLGELGKL